MESNIYKYNDGFADVFGDPMEIDYRFAKAEESEDMEVVNRWLKLPTDADGNVLPESRLDPGVQGRFMEACWRMVPIIRAGFECHPFDKATGKGLTMDQLLGLWADYMTWRSSVKKNTEESPTDATPSASPAISSPASRVPPISPVPRPRSAFMGSTSTPGGSRQSPVPNSSGASST